MRSFAHSEASERNKRPILAILETAFERCTRVLEIGSGTGQHAVHFARGLPHVRWQPTDLEENLPDLEARLAAEAPANVAPAIRLDVREHPWPVTAFDGVFTANTLHIMSFEAVGHFFQGIGEALETGGVLCVYGPFSYAGRHTSASNAEFDRYLRRRDPVSGVRDFDEVAVLARRVGLELVTDHAMPANNRTLVWRRPAQ